MKSKPRATKSAHKPAGRVPAKKAAARKKPAVKAVSRGPRATAAKRATAVRKPARKAKSAASTRTAKKPARATKKATAKRPAAKKPVRKTVARRSRNGRSNGRMPVVREFTKREAWTLFDGEARKRTGMSGKAFIEWWHRGEFEKDPDDMPGVMGVAMLLPLVEAD